MKKIQKRARASKRYHYTQCGLDYIFLVNGFEPMPGVRGGNVMRIHDVEGLHRAIGEMLTFEKKDLDGKEFRFLRYEINITQQNLADLMGVDVQTIGRWEREETDIPGPAQRIIRLLYSEKVVAGNPGVCESLKRLADMDEGKGQLEIDFRVNDGWQPALAA